MRDFAGVTNSSGAFPNVVAADDPTPGVGTLLEERWVTELFGAFQALLSAAGLAPDGSAEAAAASQILESIRYIAGNPGEIVGWSGPTIPAGMRLLGLEGQLIAIASYAKLVENVYCGNPHNATAPAFYKATAAGVRDTGGTHFKLPDARGYFLRGIASGTTIDPEGARLAGAVQAESIAEHNHDKLYFTSVSPLNEITKDTGAGLAKSIDTLTNNRTGASMITGDSGTGIGVGTANETRPDNIAVRWCIRY